MTFTFNLEAVKEGSTAEPPMPGETELEITLDWVETSAPTSFGKMTFVAPGTYNYKITETEGSEDGVIYDKTEWLATVVIGTDDKGNLTKTVTYKKGESTNTNAAAFVNTFAKVPY